MNYINFKLVNMNCVNAKLVDMIYVRIKLYELHFFVKIQKARMRNNETLNCGFIYKIKLSNEKLQRYSHLFLITTFEEGYNHNNHEREGPHGLKGCKDQFMVKKIR